MKTELSEAMTAGVFVEFRDSQGHTIGQALYTDWCGRPVPAVGDVLACEVRATAGPRVRTFRGRVVSRRFEVQRELDGTPCVWAHVIVESAKPRPKPSPHNAQFSQN